MNLAPAPPPAPGPAPLRVLVIEDSALDAGLMIRELEHYGYTVDWQRVATTSTLQAALAGRPWDVVLSDYALPHLRGLEALAIVQDRDRDLPFILVSGTIGEETAVEAMRAGACDYLLKDRLARLGPAVARVLREAQERRARRQAEEALRTSEAQLSNAINIARLGYWEYDVADDLFTFNDPFYAIFRTSAEQAGGYKLSPARYAALFVHPDDRHIVADEMNLALETTDPNFSRQLEHRIVYADGETGYVSVRFFVVKDEQGRTVKTFGANQDITERKRAEEEIRQHAARLEALRQVGLELATQLNLDTLLRSIVERAFALVGGQWGSFDFYRPKLDTLVSSARVGAAPGLPNVQLRRGEGLSGKVWASGQPIIVDDYQGWPERALAYEGYSVHAIMGVPVRWGDEFLGVLNVGAETSGAFSPASAELLALFATQAAIAIHNARLYSQAVQAAERREVLHRASQEIVRALHDPEQVYQAIHRAAAALMPVEAFAIVLYDEARRENKAVYLIDRGGRWPALRFPGDQGLSGRVMATRRPLLIDDSLLAATPPAVHFGQPESVRSILAVPLRLGKKVVGMISVQSYQPQTYTAEDQSLLEMLAAHAAATLENVRLFDEAQHRNRELALLNRVIAATAAAAGQGIESILDTVCRELALALDVPQSAAALYDDKKTQGVVVAEYLAPGRPSALGERIPVADNPASQHLLQNKTPLVVEDAQTDPRLAPIHGLMRHRGTVSLLLLPLIVDGEVLGSLGVDALAHRPFAAEEVDLARRVSEQASGVLARARLEEQRRQLEKQFLQAQKLEAVGRLAGGVAHDFNNLLTVIQISSKLLERKLRPEDPLWEHVQRIQDAAQRATNLTRQLLAFSRRDMVEPHLLNLNEVVGNLDRMLQRLIGEDVRLKTTLAADLWPVKVDPTQIDQVLLNLAVNARDAMPTGGRLTIETANVVLDSAYAAHHLDVEPGEYVLLAVGDTGLGMNDEVKAHIFEPFFTTKEKGKGTGLGLATVHGIIKQNHGHIWIQSEPGQGTTVKIYLPHAMAGTRAPSSQPAEAALPPELGSETLLLVEDETSVRELTRDILRGRGYRVLTARDGVEALRVAAQHDGPIHLLLTDVIMPHMSGRVVADQLRATRPEMRVLYTSGYTDDAILHHGVLAEGTHFLAKPFELETLTRKVRSVLDGSADR